MELISKEDVLKCFRTTLLLPSDVDIQPIMLWYEQILGNIKSLPIIESRPKASWSITINQDYRCSNCELITSSYKANFCPHCGSEMINSASKEKKNEQSDKSG